MGVVWFVDCCLLLDSAEGWLSLHVWVGGWTLFAIADGFLVRAPLFKVGSLDLVVLGLLFVVLLNC